MQTQASAEAHEKIKPIKLTIRERIYNFIKENPNANIFEICKGLNLKEKTVSGRLSELTDSCRITITRTVEGLSLFVIDTPTHFNIMVRRADKFKSKIAQLEKNYPDLLANYIHNKTK